MAIDEKIKKYLLEHKIRGYKKVPDENNCSNCYFSIQNKYNKIWYCQNLDNLKAAGENYDAEADDLGAIKVDKNGRCPKYSSDEGEGRRQVGFNEASDTARARAEFQVLLNTIENIIDKEVERAEEILLEAERKIAFQFRKAVEDVIEEIDDAGAAAEGAWFISPKAIDKFFKDKYQNLVREYVMKPKEKMSHPIVDGFWEAVDSEWIERQ